MQAIVCSTLTHLLRAFIERLLLVGRTPNTMMPPKKSNPRAEYRLREIERVNAGSERNSTASIKVSRGTLTGS
jgi:hypothetical protein